MDGPNECHGLNEVAAFAVSGSRGVAALWARPSRSGAERNDPDDSH
jgi:hypothetical protein